MIDAGKCWKCGCQVMLPDELYSAAKRTTNVSFFCAYGHKAIFPEGETESAKLRRERDVLKQQQARLEDEAKQAWATATAQRKRADKAERATKRLKKRASAGTCPCCSRTFSNMSEHMKRQHPTFVAEGGANVVSMKAVALAKG
jgi:hypothetical protein